MRRALLIAVATLCSLTLLSPAAAETEDWAVVPVTRGEVPSYMERIVVELGRELERHGKPVWRSEDAAARFKRESSTVATEVSDEDLHRWSRDSRAGVRHLSYGDHASALDRLEQAEQFSRHATEELNRESPRAQRVLDTCLYMVRALLESAERPRAIEYSDDCARLVPRSSPAALMHPPAVLALYERALAAGRRNVGGLLVDSSPAGCDVRINGVLFGSTPLETEELLSGEYSVQVECDAQHRGRVHSVKIGAEARLLHIDDRFDRAVRTKPVLRLQYAKDAEEDRWLMDARELARVLPARMLVLVSSVNPNMVAIELMSRNGIRRGCARIKSLTGGPGPRSLSRAAEGLFQGKCGALSASNAASSQLFKPGI